MIDPLESRLAELRRERDRCAAQLAELVAHEGELRELMLRLDGQIQVLEELRTASES